MQNQAKNSFKIQIASITELTYAFEALLGQYFRFHPSFSSPFARRLCNCVAASGQFQLYAVFLSLVLTVLDFAPQAPPGGPDGCEYCAAAPSALN